MTQIYSIDCPIGVVYKKLDENAKTPEKMTEGSSGYDLYAAEDCILKDTTPKAVSTKIAIELPKHFEGQIRGRSSMSLRGIHTHLGTIDQDYRGELKVILQNLDPMSPYIIKKGDRIAQLVIAPTAPTILFNSAELKTTDRGDGGFGSTGR